MLTELPEKIETEAWAQLGEGEEAAYRDAVQRRNLQAMRHAVTLAARVARPGPRRRSAPDVAENRCRA